MLHLIVQIQNLLISQYKTVSFHFHQVEPLKSVCNRAALLWHTLSTLTVYAFFIISDVSRSGLTVF